MLRRTFMALLGSAAACPIAADAQQGGSPKRIGFIAGGVRPTPFEGSLYDAFPQGMRALGYVEGKDFVVEWRFANGKYERFPEFAKEMVDLKVDAIVLGAMAAVRPTQVVTSSIPIIMGNSIDPVGNGLVASLSHPGGNTTGLSSAYEEIIPKLIETLAIVVLQLSRVGMFINPNNPIHASNLKFSDAPASKLKITVLPVPVGKPEDIESAFEAMKEQKADGVIVPADAFYLANRNRLTELAIQSRLPSIFAQREYAISGGLMSYGENLADFYKRAAVFVDKILKGAKPSELPVEQPIRFLLVINRKTAEKIGVNRAGLKNLHRTISGVSA
jgi:putative ABC transport system substrate-binding protein